jgi:hypothetical protein
VLPPLRETPQSSVQLPGRNRVEVTEQFFCDLEGDEIDPGERQTGSGKEGNRGKPDRAGRGARPRLLLPLGTRAVADRFVPVLWAGGDGLERLTQFGHPQPETSERPLAAEACSKRMAPRRLTCSNLSSAARSPTGGREAFQLFKWLLSIAGHVERRPIPTVCIAAIGAGTCPTTSQLTLYVPARLCQILQQPLMIMSVIVS